MGIRLICAEFLDKGDDSPEIFEAHAVGDRVIFLEDVTAFMHEDGKESLDFRLDPIDVVPEHGIQPSVKDKFVAAGLFQMNRIHSCLDLEGIESVKTDLDELRNKGVDVAAGVEVSFDAFFVRPLDGALLDRLQDFAVHGRGKKRAVAVSHVIAPEYGVEGITLVPDHIEELKVAVELGIEDVNHKFRVFRHPYKERLCADNARMSDVEPEP